LGGAYSKGIIFKINTDGSGFTKLTDFDGSNKGMEPIGGLTLSGNTLYGMTELGGTNNLGTAFKVNTDGTGFGKLFDFDGTLMGSDAQSTFTLSGNNVLYGATFLGGVNPFDGIVFAVNTDGSGFEKLHDFADTINGRGPSGSLVLSDNVLYGMTSLGGIKGKGVIFKYILSDQTGIPNNIGPKCELYPNPVNDLLQIKNNQVIARVEMVNLMGQTVVSKNYNANEVTVTFSNLPAGLYTVRVYDKSGSFLTGKIMKK
jgi:uncharacterized repeat protein (TIGR03803 family)